MKFDFDRDWPRFSIILVLVFILFLVHAVIFDAYPRDEWLVTIEYTDGTIVEVECTNIRHWKSNDVVLLDSKRYRVDGVRSMSKKLKGAI